jgi:oligoendopeptidase F
MKYPQTWDLDSLYPHPETESFQALFTELEESFRDLAKSVGLLPPPSPAAEAGKAWIQFLDDWARLKARKNEVDTFIGCHAAADAANKVFRMYEARLSSLSPLEEQVATELEFSLQGCDAASLAEFIEAAPDLSRIAFFLRERQDASRFRLPKDQELLAADLSVDGLHAWGRLYDRISGDLRVRVMQRGEIVEKSPGQVQFDDPSRTVRENNFHASRIAWSTIADTCADALNHLSGTRLTKYRRLGLADHLAVPLHENRMQRETLETMWSEITAFKPLLAKYLAQKARLLKLEKPCWFDLQAPLPEKHLGEADPRIPYDTACEMILSAFGDFSPELSDFARMSLENSWVEADNRSGKRQGGFCAGLPLQQQSRIFMTYTSTADSMSTLAHELGHAYHSWVLKDEPLLLQDYPMNLAETASTFAESVLGEARLSSPGEASQLAILDGMLADAVSFLMNIHARFLFEDRFHRERLKGELTPERFSELMAQAQREAYCDALDENGLYDQFWVSKLHFYISGYPFYNFPYTFGYLLSLGLYALADRFGDGFPERYRQLLINTGCMQAEEAVFRTFDQDLTKPDFWRNSLQVVGNRVHRFLELSENL